MTALSNGSNIGGVTFIAGTEDSAIRPAIRLSHTSWRLEAPVASTLPAPHRRKPDGAQGRSISRYEASRVIRRVWLLKAPRSVPFPMCRFDSDPNTGVWIYDTYNNPYGGPWTALAATSFAPCLGCHRGHHQPKSRQGASRARLPPQRIYANIAQPLTNWLPAISTTSPAKQWQILGRPRL